MRPRPDAPLVIFAIIGSASNGRDELIDSFSITSSVARRTWSSAASRWAGSAPLAFAHLVNWLRLFAAALSTTRALASAPARPGGGPPHLCADPESRRLER